MLYLLSIQEETPIRGNQKSLERKATIRLYFSMPGSEQDTMYCVERELGGRKLELLCTR